MNKNLVVLLFVAVGACECEDPTTCATSVCCVPKTCESPDIGCGAVPDGCGGTLSCGCSGGQTCQGDAPRKVCAACRPLACADVTACGEVADGCGGTLACGCPEGKICQGEAPQKACVDCTPRSCSEATACGLFDDGCGGQVRCPCTFLEEFVDTQKVDAAKTTAVIATVSPGLAWSNTPLAIESARSGKDGKWAPSTAASAQLPGGTFEYSEVSIVGTGTRANLDIDGDLTLYVHGPFLLSNKAYLNVHGNLTIVTDGPFKIDCGFIEADGRVTVHQSSADGIDVGCENPAIGQADLNAGQGNDPTDAGLQIWTRGALRAGRDSYLVAGKKPGWTVTGDIEIRAYGDVTAQHDSYFVVDDSGFTDGVPGTNGTISVYTEGRITLDDNSYFTAGHPYGLHGGSVLLHALGDISLINSSYVIPGSGGNVEVLSEGAISLSAGADGGSYVFAGRDSPDKDRHLLVRGKSLTLSGESEIDTSHPGTAKEIAELIVEVSGDVVLTGESSIAVWTNDCGVPGGNVTVRAGGKITVDELSVIGAGEGGCEGTPAAGGNLELRAAGAISLAGTTPAERAHAGPGTPPGTLTITGNVPVDIGPLEAGVLSRTRVRSLALPQGVAGAVIDAAASLPELPPTSCGVLLSPDGSETGFVALAEASGKPLGAGFLYEVRFVGHMFDAVSLDRISVGYH